MPRRGILRSLLIRRSDCRNKIYHEAKELLREVATRFEVVGVDFVDVSPPYDPSGITALPAARTSLDLIGSTSTSALNETTRNNITGAPLGAPATRDLGLPTGMKLQWTMSPQQINPGLAPGNEISLCPRRIGTSASPSVAYRMEFTSPVHARPASTAAIQAGARTAE